MTDVTATNETEPNRDQSADGPAEGESASEAVATTDDVSTGTKVRTYLAYALLVGLSLLALIAALQFYSNASAVIDQWIADEYRSLFQAAFNLVVLLVAAAGITWQARRLGDRA